MTLIGVAAKNVLRNRFRTVLTVLGVAVAILTFVFLRTVLNAWYVAADNAAKDRVITRHKVTLVMNLPKRYVEEVRQVPGVKQAGYANWFDGKVPGKEDDFFATFAVDKDYFDIVSEMAVPADQLETWKGDKQGAIVGDVLAKKWGWSIGDKVVLDSGIYPAPYDSPWTFTIQGIYTATAKSVDRSSFILHWEYLNDTMPPDRQEQIGWVFSRVADGANPADVSAAIDARFDVMDIQTLTQDERAFNTSFLGGFSAILEAMNLISGVILVIMMLVLGNTIAMGVRERTQEYGVLRAIGFRPRHLVAFILGEAAVTAIVGGGLGVLLSYPLIERMLGRAIEENMGSWFPYFRVPPSAMVAALGLSVVLGLVAAALPAWGASKLKVTEALRRVA